MAIQNLNKKLDSYQVRRNKSKKGWMKPVAILFIVLVILYFPIRGVYTSLKDISAQAKAVSADFKQENLDQIRADLAKMRGSVDNLDGSLNWLFPLRFIPFLGGYYLDAKHFATAAHYELLAVEKIAAGLDPYKQELGFTGQPTPGQDRVAQFVKILDKTLPQIDKVEPDMKKASDEVSVIDTGKYPQNFGKYRLRNQIEIAKNFIIGAHIAVTEARPALEVAPSILGEPAAKNYLLLFQNDKEIRSTGGFITAYAFLRIEQGHLSVTKSDDIYRLDEQLLNVCKSKVCPLTPPNPIARYLPEADGKPRTAWSLRDSNISPDLPTSIKQFERMYALLGEGVPFDGVMTIDTEVVNQLIQITGPVEVFGTRYSADIDKRCNCANVIYELENYAEIAAKGQADRKAVIGALMQQILGRALGSSTQELPDLINTGVRLAGEKHLMFYMHDDKTQTALSKLGWTGDVKQTAGDYLMVIDSNFAGGKSNLYVEEKVTYEVDAKALKAKVTIEYKNPQPFNTWLNGIYRDYVRIYVPSGSRLILAKGSDVEVTTISSDLGKTAFEAFVTVRPQNSRVLSFEYSLPQNYVAGNNYPLLIQKQPGARDYKYEIKINGRTKSNFVLTQDNSLNLSL
ncbi:DUF4012 domain-containing protein [Candidatus Daviesbacteria bacterium]|nr:DUF4012 domain-containing protein [Candidatus Daviesbacteria bacterium]